MRAHYFGFLHKSLTDLWKAQEISDSGFKSHPSVAEKPIPTVEGVSTEAATVSRWKQLQSPSEVLVLSRFTGLGQCRCGKQLANNLHRRAAGGSPGMRHFTATSRNVAEGRYVAERTGFSGLFGVPAPEPSRFAFFLVIAAGGLPPYTAPKEGRAAVPPKRGVSSVRVYP
jgi:hypothetical protein